MPDPVEIIKIAVPILLQAVAVALFILMIATWAAMVSGA